MAKFKIRKGNFFNQLTGNFDPKIVDGNQYDLEVTINNTSNYYRVRLIDGYFEAFPIRLESDEFHSPGEQNNCKFGEISNFFKTDFYRHNFALRNEFEHLRNHLRRLNVFDYPDYINFLKRGDNRKYLQGHTLYDFCLPAVGSRRKTGVLSYDISIEVSRKYYHLIFVKENAEKGFNQTEDILYMIYNKPNFKRFKREFEEIILDFCLKNNSPINLTSLLYLICDGDENLINNLYSKIMRAKSKNEIKTLLLDSSLNILNPSLLYDPILKSEFQKFVTSDLDDINYDFSRKRF